MFQCGLVPGWIRESGVLMFGVILLHIYLITLVTLQIDAASEPNAFLSFFFLNIYQEKKADSNNYSNTVHACKESSN